MSVVRLSSGARLSGLSSTLISSNRANIATKSREALVEESKKPLENTIKTSPSDSYSASYLGSSYIKVAFEDAKSGQMVTTNLSLSNAVNLILTFRGENNFFLRSDGVLRLNGEAQNFVSGWFDELAYNMNLLGADADKNGLISGEENLNTFYYRTPYVYGNAKKTQDITNYTFAGGDKLAFYDTMLRGQEQSVERTIEATLDGVLSEDTNADNKISVLEHFGSLKAALGNVEMEVSSPSDNASFNPLEFILEQLKKMLQEMLEETLEGATSLESKALEQGLSALNVAELELFKSQNPLEYEKLKNEQEFTEFSNEALGENLSENLGANLDKNSSLNSDENLSAKTSYNGTNSNLSSLERALSQDLFAQIKSQNLKIVDLSV